MVKISDKYELKFEKFMPDTKADCYYLIHKKTGMKVLVLSNDDNNKVFSIGFKTKSDNSTGVAHILEHSVLCGSENYPIKDPFIELVKGSLNTFLNAMTYPDKTLYPVASTNEKDFRNLMSVYLDAVFKPNIYRNKEIFMQEGWHYCLDDINGELSYSGVVYNEMRGAYSSVSDILEREVEKSIYNNHFYGNDSGGDPLDIPKLGYEEFLEFHRTHYHPSNAYLYLYGDMDINETLEYIDETYVGKYDRIDACTIEIPKAEDCIPIVKSPYPVADKNELNDTAYFSFNVAIDIREDPNLYKALEVLSYVLVNAPGAPVSKALYEAGIGQDVSSEFVAVYAKPLFTIEAANTNEERFEEFKEIINKVLKEQVEKGVDRQALLGAINASEFRFREGDYGAYPKGLIYYLTALDYWNYNDDNPVLYLEQLSMFDFLKKNIDTGYFEKVIQERILDNKHQSVVCVYPKLDLQKEIDERVSKELAAYKAGLSKEELEGIVRMNKELERYQSSEEENKDCLPLLKKEDIGKKAITYSIEEKQIAGHTLLWHECDTNGISYVKLMFEADELQECYLPYLGMLSSVLGLVDTKSYPYHELRNEINIHLGGMSVDTYNALSAKDKDEYRFFLILKFKCLEDKLDKAIELAKEILIQSSFDNKTRIKEILQETKTAIEESAIQSGNAVAALRAASMISRANRVSDLTKGLAYYDRLNYVLENYDREYPNLLKIFQDLLNNIVSKEKLVLSLTSDKTVIPVLENKIKNFVSELGMSGKLAEFEYERDEYVNLGIIAPSSTVQYVARVGDCGDDFKYHGSLQVLKVLLSFDYLWNEIRVKGGAYGCSSSILRNGIGTFTSYRDPHLSETEKVYEGIPEYLDKIELSDRDINKYIIGAISQLDTPLSNSLKGLKALNSYLSGVSHEDYQRERDEILNTKLSDIRAAAKIVEKLLSKRYVCTIGSKEVLNKEKDRFDKLRLFSKNS